MLHSLRSLSSPLWSLRLNFNSIEVLLTTKPAKFFHKAHQAMKSNLFEFNLVNFVVKFYLLPQTPQTISNNLFAYFELIFVNFVVKFLSIQAVEKIPALGLS